MKFILLTKYGQIEHSGLTLVLWSKDFLTSEWQRAEYAYARHIELYRQFNYRVIHVFLQAMSDVNDNKVKSLVSSGDYVQWTSSKTVAEKSIMFNKLLSKIYQVL